MSTAPLLAQSAAVAVVESIFISPAAAAPMKSVQEARLVRGAGIEGDRYLLETGTYSAKFLGEPGKHLTLVSADGVEAQMAATLTSATHAILIQLKAGERVRQTLSVAKQCSGTYSSKAIVSDALWRSNSVLSTLLNRLECIGLRG